MKALYLADFILFFLFLFTVFYATSSYEVIGLLIFIFFGLPALVFFSILINN